MDTVGFKLSHHLGFAVEVPEATMIKWLPPLLNQSVKLHVD
jgi:hypothetical protein